MSFSSSFEFHEGAEEILAPADRSLSGVPGRIDRIHVRFGGRAVHLYALLESKQ